MSETCNLRKDAFKKALLKLKEALSHEKDEFLRDAAIQRFEFTYELAWKTLKHLLAEKDIVVRNAKDTLKAAYQQGMINDADGWSMLHQQGNLTSHTYDESLADAVYAFLKSKGLPLFFELEKELDRFHG